MARIFITELPHAKLDIKINMPGLKINNLKNHFKRTVPFTYYVFITYVYGIKVNITKE